MGLTHLPGSFHYNESVRVVDDILLPFYVMLLSSDYRVECESARVNELLDIYLDYFIAR
jgi:hypothetical protein